MVMPMVAMIQGSVVNAPRGVYKRQLIVCLFPPYHYSHSRRHIMTELFYSLSPYSMMRRFHFRSVKYVCHPKDCTVIWVTNYHILANKPY